MPNVVQELGDSTSREVKPDFDSAKGYYWMKQVRQAQINGATGNLPRKPRRGLAETSFFEQVDRRLSRQSFSVDIAFDKEGRRIHS